MDDGKMKIVIAGIIIIVLIALLIRLYLWVDATYEDLLENLIADIREGDKIGCGSIPEMIDLYTELGRRGIETNWDYEEYNRGIYILHVIAIRQTDKK